MESIVPAGTDRQDERHELPKEWLTVFNMAWFDCSCGERFDIPVSTDHALVGVAVRDWERHLAAVNERPGGAA